MTRHQEPSLEEVEALARELMEEAMRNCRPPCPLTCQCPCHEPKEVSDGG